MNRRKFIETSGVATGAAMLGGVTSSVNQISTAVPEQKTQ